MELLFNETEYKRGKIRPSNESEYFIMELFSIIIESVEKTLFTVVVAISAVLTVGSDLKYNEEGEVDHVMLRCQDEWHH